MQINISTITKCMSQEPFENKKNEDKQNQHNKLIQ